MPISPDDQESLIERYVSTFPKLDEMNTTDDFEHAWQLSIGDADDFGWKDWRPAKVLTDPSYLDTLYASLPARFPPLYERLVLTYRWAEIDLQSYRLLANPLGADLNGLLREITKDRGLWDALVPAGFIQFGKGPDIDYDPVCFDIKSRTKNGDFRIVKIDHEEILCNYRVKVVAKPASSFEELVVNTIEAASKI